MGDVLNMIRTTVTETLAGLWSWLIQLNLDLWSFFPFIIAIFLLLLLVFIVRVIKRRPTRPSKPSILMSNGIIIENNHHKQVLNLKVSNLNDYPVQILEITLKTELMSTAILVDAVELLAPFEAIELEAYLPEVIAGDTGSLELYCYASRRKHVLYRLQANFAWEPWASRYRMDPVQQKIRRVRKLASHHLNQLRKRAWHENKLRAPLVSNPKPVIASETRLQDSRPEPAKLERAKLDLEFPNDF